MSKLALVVNGNDIVISPGSKQLKRQVKRNMDRFPEDFPSELCKRFP